MKDNLIDELQENLRQARRSCGRPIGIEEMIDESSARCILNDYDIRRNVKQSRVAWNDSIIHDETGYPSTENRITREMDQSIDDAIRLSLDSYEEDGGE